MPRRRFLQYHYGGKGLTEVRISLPLRIGSIVHDVIEEMAQEGNWETEMNAHLCAFAEDMREAGFEEHFKAEQGALVEGMLRGFHRYRWPRIKERCPGGVFAAEMETVIDLGDGVGFMVKPDLLMLDAGGQSPLHRV